MSILPRLFCSSLRSNIVQRVIVLNTAFAVVSVIGADIAAAGPVTQNVPGTIVLVQSFRHTPDDRQCAAHIFGQWADIPATQYATVKYKDNGDAATKSSYPPYSNAGRPESSAVAGYSAVPAGFNRILIASSGGSGGSTNREEYQALCDELGATLLAAFGGPTTVELMIDQLATPTPTATPVPPSPVKITSISGVVVLSSSRKVSIGKLTCPTDGSCAITAPENVQVKIAGKEYALPVTVPKLVTTGHPAKVNVTFPRAAAKCIT